MPFYDYECVSCNHVFTEQLKIVDMDSPLDKPCPECDKEKSVKRIITGSRVGDPILLGVKKPSSQFNERLKQIQRNYPDAKGIKIR